MIQERIRQQRIKKGFTQYDMAERLGIAILNYGKIERGITQLSIKRLYEIAAILEILAVELLTGEPPAVADSGRVKELEERVMELQELKEYQRDLIASLKRQLLDN